MIFTPRNIYLLRRFAYGLVPKKQWKDITFIIFVSTGRTGTKFFATYFSQFTDNIFAKHEPYPDFTYHGNEYLKGNISEQKVLSKFVKSRKLIQQKLYLKNMNKYVESNGGLIFLLPQIQKLTENFKIVHIIRDPKSWTRSACNRRIDNNGKLLPNKKIPWKITADDFPNDPYFGKWHDMTIIDKHAWIWSKKNQMILNHISNNKNAITVKFEDIFNTNNNFIGFDSILQFLMKDMQIDFNINDKKAPLKNKVNWTKNYKFPSYDDWSRLQKKRFKEITGDLAHMFDY